jgi:Phage major capsid protein E
MANPYELWDTRYALGMMRATKPETWQFGEYFTRQIATESEWIDFEKLPIPSRKLAAFVKPMGRGTSIYTDSSSTKRFKPANVVVEEQIDPFRLLSTAPGIDSMLDPMSISPMQRRNLLRAEMTSQAMTAIERRWEWMRAKAIIDGKVTVVYESGESVLVDFGRAAGHTETLTSGNRFGDSGISFMDKVQAIIDTMTNAEFGGIPQKITMGGSVWSVVKKDPELLAAMEFEKQRTDVNIERGLIGSTGKVFKVGTISVGGPSGQTIELWVNNETYRDNSGAEQRYLGAKDMVVTASPAAIMGIQCFGRIVDMDAEFKALPIFPKNFIKGDRVKTEHLSFESAPLMVPVNPDATYKVASAVA